MEKWLHWTIMSNEIGELNTELDKAGDDGFELVTIIQPRERPETKEPPFKVVEPRFVAWMKKRMT